MKADESVSGEVKSASKGIKSAYESIQIFALPFPGEHVAEASSYKASDDDDSGDESSEDTSNVKITSSKYTADFAGIKWFTFARLSQRFSHRLIGKM